MPALSSLGKLSQKESNLEPRGSNGAESSRKVGVGGHDPMILWHLYLCRHLDTQGAPKTEQCRIPATLTARSFMAQAAAAGATPLLLPKLGAQDQPPD